jgi:hypothetical protein
MGKYCLPYAKRDELRSPLWDNYFRFGRDHINESDRFIFFSIYHRHNPTVVKGSCLFWGYYDKQLKKSRIADIDDLYQSVIIDDINHFVSLHPACFTITDKDELVTYAEAGDIAEWFENNPEKIKNLPGYLRELSEIEPEDNPVVMIIKLKQ